MPVEFVPGSAVNVTLTQSGDNLEVRATRADGVSLGLLLVLFNDGTVRAPALSPTAVSAGFQTHEDGGILVFGR